MVGERSFAQAVKWAYTANWGQKGLSSIFVVILAAILGPRDFGLVSIGVVYVAFLQLFLDQGLSTALIQRLDLSDEHLNAVFWMNQVLSVVLVAVGLLLAGWWATHNHATNASQLISVLSLDVPILALGIVQNAILTRNMNFKSLAVCGNVSALLGGIAGVSMALAGFHAWALVGQQLVRDSVNSFLLWNRTTWRPRLQFSWTRLAELMNFSIHNFTAMLAVFADVQGSSVILGLFFGPLALGLYRIADRIASSVITLAMSAIQAVSLPEFSRLQNRPDELRESILASIHLTSVITIPALAGLAAISTTLMATIGPRWSSASHVLQALSILGIAIVFAYFTAPLLQAMARTRTLAILEWARTIIGAIALVIVAVLVRGSAAQTQIVSIAVARLLAGVIIVTPIFLYILLRLSRISIREFLALTRPAATSAAVVVISVIVIESPHWMYTIPPIVRLSIDIAVGATAGLTVLLALEHQIRKSVLNIARRQFGRLALAKQVS